jgi:hypothetical protein
MLTPASSHEIFFNSRGLEYLCKAANSRQHQAHFYIAEILAMLCSNDSHDGNPYIEKLTKSGMVDAVLKFCVEEDEEIRYSGVALLLNFVSVSSKLT